MFGLNSETGQPLSGIDHLRQSIRDILTTRIGARVMRRDYGLLLPGLVDNPMTPSLAMDLYNAAARAALLAFTTGSRAAHYRYWAVSASVLAAVRADVRALTDTLEMVAAEKIAVSVAALLAAHSGLGWDLTRSWIIGRLQRTGVHKVELLSPAADIRIAANQAVRLTGLTLEFAGRDR